MAWNNKPVPKLFIISVYVVVEKILIKCDSKPKVLCPLFSFGNEEI